jgi:hypothetical protein
VQARRFWFPPGARSLPADTIPTVEPSRVTAGDTWQWRRTVAGYSSADSWLLAYYLEGPGKLTDGITGVAEDGGGWLITVGPAASKDLPAGAYQLHGFVETRDEDDVVTARHRIWRAGLLVRRDPATITAPRRSHNEEMYELITARLENRLPQDRENVTIDGTQITRIAIPELYRLRNLYAEGLRVELGGALIQAVGSRDPL